MSFDPTGSPTSTSGPQEHSAEEFRQRKQQLRQQAHLRRKEQKNKDELSRKILAQFFALPEYQQAETVLFYVDVRSEVRTRHDLPDALTHGKRVVVPYCVDDILKLFPLQSMDELSLGAFKILEPQEELRSKPEKQLDIQQVDLVMVPGVAFDRRGARMGHGFGYYDKLLENAPAKTPRVALAFECQLYPEIPTDPHDIFMHKIITEEAVYECRPLP